MISIKDLSDAELETLTTSRSPTIVITANGEVQTHEEATVYVKELDIFFTMKVLEDTPAVLSVEKLFDEHGYSYEWINCQKNKSHFRIQCNTENFVPIVYPGLSTSSSSSLPSSTSMTPSRQEIDHPTSSSSSSTSPTMTSSTVSSDSVAGQERGDLCGIDSYPAAVSSKHVERQERRDPCSSGIPEEQLLTKPTKNPKPQKTKTTIKNGETCVIPTYRSGCKRSEKTWWMTKSQDMETLTPVRLMNHL